PLAMCSALVGEGASSKLLILWRVLKDPQAARNTPGEVRLTTFDGVRFGPMATLPFDLVAMTVVTEPGQPLPLLFGARAATDDATIAVWRQTAAGTFEPEGAPVAYEREGLMGSQGVVGLASTMAGDRLLLAAQVGSTIR